MNDYGKREIIAIVQAMDEPRKLNLILGFVRRLFFTEDIPQKSNAQVEG